MFAIIVIPLAVATMIFFNALYVAGEFATVASRRTRVSQLAGQGNRRAQALLPILEDSHALDHYVAACQLGITISSLVLGAYGQSVIAIKLVGPLTALLSRLAPQLALVSVDTSGEAAGVMALTIATFGVLIIITILQVILGELFPKSVAIQYPERLALLLVWPVKFSAWLFTWLIWLFNGSAAAILRLFGRNLDERPSRAHSAREIELLVTESHEGGLLDDQERLMLRNAFRLRDLTARQVMLHRTRLMAAPEEATVDEVLEMAIAAGYSRIPVYEGSIDRITGFAHVRDLFRLRVGGETSIDSIIREPVYVPESMPVIELWERLNTRRKYLAVVFDEFGGTAGLITFEDLIEEVFGELQDEFDDEEALVARDKAGRIYLRGDLLVSDVNEYLALALPTDSADTLGGLVFSELGRPPTVGDNVVIGDTTIQVEAMADLGVTEVSLLVPRGDGEMTFGGEWEVIDIE